MRNSKSVWILIAKALGEKTGRTNEEADRVAFIRLIITLQILLTNFFIVYGVIRTHHLPMKPSHKEQIEKLTQELNGKVDYKTVVSKTQSKQQIVITYNEQRR